MSARTDQEAVDTQMSTGITPDTLGATLKEKLEAIHVDISDLSGMIYANRHEFFRWQTDRDRWMWSNV